jgi:hypothetical protein
MRFGTIICLGTAIGQPPEASARMAWLIAPREQPWIAMEACAPAGQPGAGGWIASQDRKPW